MNTGDLDCPRIKDDNTPCYLKDGTTALTRRSNTDTMECMGCKWTLKEVSQDAARRLDPGARKFSALLSILQIGPTEKIIVEGVNIAHLTRGVDISCRPGELMDVQLSLLLNSTEALDIPETMATLSVVDLSRSIELEMVLAELISLLKVDEAELDVEVAESMRRAERVLGKEQLSDKPDTVAQRRMKKR